jgi:hypothetical protein
MDNPTPRSKTDRETECTIGALDPKRGPLIFSPRRAEPAGITNS